MNIFFTLKRWSRLGLALSVSYITATTGIVTYALNTNSEEGGWYIIFPVLPWLWLERYINDTPLVYITLVTVTACMLYGIGWLLQSVFSKTIAK